MKRLVSLDFLRGFAIFFMIIGHVFTKIYTIQSIDVIMTISPIILVIGGPLYILGRQRAFFLLISSISYAYSMNLDLKQNRPRISILKKNLFRAILLYCVALLVETFFHPWGIFPRYIVNGIFREDLLTMVFYFDTLHMIAIGMILSSILFYLFTFLKGKSSRFWGLSLYSLLGLIAIFITPFIHQIANDVYQTTSYYLIQLTPVHTVGEFFQRLYWSALIGLQEPIFPFFGTVCIGNIIGDFLSQDSPPRNFPRYGFITSGVFVISGIVMLFVGHYEFNFWGEDEPTWLYLIFTGFQLFVVFLFLRFREFNPKPASRKISKLVRMFLRWSHVSLTIYILEPLDIFPRLLMTWITGQDFAWFFKITNIFWAFGMIFILLIFWDLIIRLWEKGHFIGSWEWIFAKFNSWIMKSPLDSKDPLNIHGLIYNIEPINYIPEIEKNLEGKV
jgi:uncharacterized membrane protein